MVFSKHNRVYRLFCQHQLSVPVEKAWEFFSSPKNLEALTPDNLKFNIECLDSNNTYPGQIICYSIRLNRLFKMNWVTEITHLKEQEYFVDEQRFGPYKMWHHIHRFKANEQGVLMTDDIYFKLPFPFFSSLIFKFFVKNNLEQIFNYRKFKLEELIRMNLL